MGDPNRRAGTISLQINGKVYDAVGAMNLNLGRPKRTALVGADRLEVLGIAQRGRGIAWVLLIGPGPIGGCDMQRVLGQQCLFRRLVVAGQRLLAARRLELGDGAAGRGDGDDRGTCD